MEPILYYHVILFGFNRLPDTALGWMCLDMNFCLLRLIGIEWNDMQWFGKEIICKVLAWDLLGESEENTSAWHLGYLTFHWDLSFVHTQNTNMESVVVVRSAWSYSCIRPPVICVCMCVFVCCFCVPVFVCFLDILHCSKRCLCTSLFQMSSYIYLSTHLFLWQQCNIYILFFPLVSVSFFQHCVKLVFDIPPITKMWGAFCIILAVFM
jgi:hypothetical protein